MWTVTAAQPPPTPSEHFEECRKTLCFVSCPPCCCCLCWSCSSCGVVRVGSRALTLRQQVQDPTSWSGLEQLVTATAPLMDQKYALEALLHFTSLFYAPLERPTVPLFNFKSRSAPEECLLKINLSKEGQEMLKSKDI